MRVQIERHTVAFVRDGGIVEHEVDVWGVDKMRAELEARRHGLRAASATKGKGDAVDVRDLGDMLNREALNLWAACLRLGLYEDPAVKWRTEDYVGSVKHKAEGSEEGGLDVDPTQSAASTSDASPSL